MNLRSRFAVLLAASLTCALPQLPAMAQSTASQSRMGLDEMKARLALTAEQEARIAPFVEERREQLAAVRADLDSTASRRDKRAALKRAKSIQDDFIAKVEPVLTSEQQAEWDKMRKEMRAQGKERLRKR